MIRRSPSPYIAITALTSSCASSRARGSGSASTSALSDWTRSSSSSGSASVLTSGQPGGRVDDLPHLSLARVHVDTARQAWVEASHGSHDVDTLEVLRAILLEDRRVLHGVLVRSRSAVGVAWARVPRRRWVRLIVGDLAFA